MFFTKRRICFVRGFLKEKVYSLILLYTHPNLKTLKTIVPRGRKHVD